MRVIGLMSGTSADGIDAALAEIDEGAVRLLEHRHIPYEPALRERVLAAASSAPLGAHDLARLHVALGDAYADAVLALGVSADLVALHGQTVAHLPGERATLQLGDAARVAVRTGIRVASDFRSADVAAGGQGAPLVPFADHAIFGAQAPIVVLNLGGIANLTLIPSRNADDVRACDTGPGNMVQDALARTRGEPFDRDGAGARRGAVHAGALAWALGHPYFARAAPKSTGREEFGKPFATALLARAGGVVDDALATAVALTARTVADQLPRDGAWRELLVAGGGARNPAVVAAVARAVAPLAVRATDAVGVPAEAREALAFAVLGAYRLLGRPNTLPHCTGASRAVCAGALYLP